MDKSRVEPIIFFIEKLSFSLKLFSGHFYGQSFIKTVRGPLSNLDQTKEICLENYYKGKEAHIKCVHAIKYKQCFYVPNQSPNILESPIL